MGKDFPDAGSDSYAYHPGDGGAFSMPKIVPTTPASQSDRPQLRPVLKPSTD